jgi:hypothetical protein
MSYRKEIFFLFINIVRCSSERNYKMKRPALEYKYIIMQPYTGWIRDPENNLSHTQDPNLGVKKSTGIPEPDRQYWIIPVLWILIQNYLG